MSETNYETIRKKEIAKTYFSNQKIIDKVIAKPASIVGRISETYSFFQRNPESFKEFYQEKFRKTAESIDDLNNPKKYGVIISKIQRDIRAEEREIDLENFLDNVFPKMPQTLRLPGSTGQSKGLGFGKWYFADENWN